MKVSIAINNINDYCKERIKNLKNKFNNIETNNIEDNKERDFSDSDIIIGGKLSKTELNEAKKLKAFFLHYTGLNNLPLQELEDRNIVVTNTHGKSHIVAEKALSLTLATMGRLVEYHLLLKNEGKWNNWKNWEDDFWNSLYDKKCAIFGMGSIGKNIINLLKPFNCKIVGLERDRTKGLADIYAKDIVDMAEKCDVFFVSVPLTDDTKGIINKKILSKMKGSFLINIARGCIVDEKDLYEALKDGTLAGAGIDAWYNYPKEYDKPTFPSQYPIYKFENVVVSPHSASHAKETINSYYEDIFDQLEYYLENNQFQKKLDLNKYI